MIEESNKLPEKVGIFAVNSSIQIENFHESRLSDTETALPINWSSISRKMLENRQKLTTNPLTSTEGIALQVEDVYVPLGLVERKKQSKRDKQDEGVSSEQGSELYKETEITKTFEHNKFLDEVLKHKQSPKSNSKRIAIIGEPGSGKTTLLQRIAHWLSREIEESIVIWISLADLQGKTLKSYLFNDWLDDVAQQKGKVQASDQIKDDFVTQFNQGRVWLLLDGLDEMSVPFANPLTEIARQLFAGSVSKARVIMTCRVNLWDSSGHTLASDFDTYRTLEFSYPYQVERFICRWFSVIPEGERERGQKLCTALKESGKERIQDLVKNPLRLTLLCLNWQFREGKLPNTKAELYQQFVDDFYNWKKKRFLTDIASWEQLEAKLRELSKEAIDKETTRFRLQEKFVNRFLGKADDENSLLKLALELGWLNHVGIDAQKKPVYAFFHASFQEYFAATAVKNYDFFLPCEHTNKPIKDKPYRIFETQWKEVILLWLGCTDVDREQKKAFIDALVDFNDGCGGHHLYEFPTYFLAAAGIGEFRDYYRSNEIVKQIVDWIIGFWDKKEGKREFYFTEFIKNDAQQALLETDYERLIEILVKLLESTQNEDIDRGLALFWENIFDILKKVSKNSCYVIDYLTKLIKLTKNEYLLGHAGLLLGEIDPDSAVVALLKKLESIDDNNEHLWLMVLNSLEIVGEDNPTLILILRKMLESTQDKKIRLQIKCSLLRIIDLTHETGVTFLLEILYLNHKKEVHQNKSYDDIKVERITKAFFQLAKKNKISMVFKDFSIESKLKLENYPELLSEEADRVIQWVITKISQHGNETARYLLSEAHNIITRHRLAVRERESDVTNNHDDIEVEQWFDENRKSYVSELTQIIYYNQLFESIVTQELVDVCTEKENEIVIACLINLVKSSKDEKICEFAFNCLCQICIEKNCDDTMEMAVNILLKLWSESIDNESFLVMGVSWLEEILKDNSHPVMIASLEKILDSTQDEHFCVRVACTLGTIDQGNYKAIKTLEKILDSTQDECVRGMAVYSLGEIGIGNGIVVEALEKIPAQSR